MALSSTEYKIPDFILREATSEMSVGAVFDGQNARKAGDAEGAKNTENLAKSLGRPPKKAELELKIYEELSAIAEEVERCRARSM